MALINIQTLRNQYIAVYKLLRNYVLSYNTVEYLADLEVQLYSAFPDISVVKTLCYKIIQDIRMMDIHDREEREEIVDVLSKLADMAESSEDVVMRLHSVKETVAI